MNQRILLSISAVTIALVLIMVAVVVPGVSQPGAAPAPQATAAPPVQPAPANTPINTQPQPAPANTPENAQPQPAPATYAISADQAGTLALASAPGATLAGTPVIVTYQGIVAYEVPLSAGMAYIDAGSGQVIASPATTGVNTGSGGGNGGDGGDDDDDDEGDDDD